MNRIRLKPALVCGTWLLLAFSLGLSAQDAAAPETAATQAATEAATAATAQPATEAAAAVAPAATLPPPKSFSNKWRMEISGSAKSDGKVVLRITPKDGQSIMAEVAIAKKTGENDVAKALVKGLKAQLDKKMFHVERDDGEDVLVKKKGRTPNFALELISSDVKNVRVHIEKE